MRAIKTKTDTPSWVRCDDIVGIGLEPKGRYLIIYLRVASEPERVFVYESVVAADAVSVAEELIADIGWEITNDGD